MGKAYLSLIFIGSLFVASLILNALTKQNKVFLAHSENRVIAPKSWPELPPLKCRPLSSNLDSFSLGSKVQIPARSGNASLLCERGNSMGAILHFSPHTENLFSIEIGEGGWPSINLVKGELKLEIANALCFVQSPGLFALAVSTQEQAIMSFSNSKVVIQSGGVFLEGNSNLPFENFSQGSKIHLENFKGPLNAGVRLNPLEKGANILTNL